jgi:hypothetical protein
MIVRDKSWQEPGALPNEPSFFELSDYIDRRQGRWDESIRNLERAQERDSRNFFQSPAIELTFEKNVAFPEHDR